MRKRALSLLRKRVREARRNPALLADIAHGFKLLEGDPMLHGRVETLHDLMQRAEEAESTHDPKVLDALINALSRFLDEELAEAMRASARAKRSDQSETGECESCGHGLESEYRDEATGTITCRKCGHEQQEARREAKRARKLTCAACKHTFAPKAYEAGGMAACPKCNMPVAAYATEGDDADDYLPYLPAPRDDSTEVRNMRSRHRSKKKRTEKKSRRTESGGALFKRLMRGDDAPRPSRHLSPAAQFAELMGLAPARTSPRPPSPVAARFTRLMHGNAAADLADHLAAQGKSPGSIFKALQAARR
jgi:hypothetical protein